MQYALKMLYKKHALYVKAGNEPWVTGSATINVSLSKFS